MKLLLISTNDSGGGAANACLRLFEALRGLGVEVRLLVAHGDSSRAQTAVLGANWLGRMRLAWYKLSERLQILWHHRRFNPLWRISTASSGFDLTNHPWVQEADIIHLHWINQGFLGLKGLRSLAKLGKPIVWTLHDLWPITGGCHLPLILESDRAVPCPNLREGCKVCPILREKRENRLTGRLYTQKSFLANACHYIAVSQSEQRIMRSNPHFVDTPVEVIAPPMPQPISAVSTLSLPDWYRSDRIYILTAATRLDDVVKGGELLRKICRRLVEIAPSTADRLTLLLVGELRSGYKDDDYALDTIYIGKVSSMDRMRQLYSLASLTISTSLFETFGQTLTEALGCGCPVVSFAAGGPEDIIIPGENGYLVEGYDTEAYARAIVDALCSIEAGGLSSEACRRSIERFSPNTIAQRHIDLYERVLSKEFVALSRQK